MTFKAKSVLQRQCCNAWTKFRGCVLHRDLSHAVSSQEKRSPHISCCTNRIRHLLFLCAVLVGIDRVVETGLRWVSDSFKWLISTPLLGVSVRGTLSAYTLLAWGVALAQCAWGNWVFVSAVLPSQFTTGCALSSSLKGSKCVLSEQFYSNKAASIIYTYLFY